MVEGEFNSLTDGEQSLYLSLVHGIDWAVDENAADGLRPESVPNPRIQTEVKQIESTSYRSNKLSLIMIISAPLPSLV